MISVCSYSYVERKVLLGIIKLIVVEVISKRESGWTKRHENLIIEKKVAFVCSLLVL